jgi:hypothetical protein
VTAIHFHPTFADQFERLVNDETTIEIGGEVSGLLLALESRGREIERSDISHPIIIARYDIHALRRTPPNEVCPYADKPPVIRIFYAWFVDSDSGVEFAVVFEMGDKSLSAVPNHWYAPIISRIETQSIPVWESRHPMHRARTRRTR